VLSVVPLMDTGLRRYDKERGSCSFINVKSLALLRVLSALVVNALALKSASLFSFVLSRGNPKKNLLLYSVLSVVKALALIPNKFSCSSLCPQW